MFIFKTQKKPPPVHVHLTLDLGHFLGVMLEVVAAIL